MKSKLFVIGKPIKHSRSPTIHNYWIEKYSLDASYNKLEVEMNEIQDLIRDLKEERIRGFNVTIPYKKVIIDFVDELEESSLKSNAVNTVYKAKNKIIGANTDGLGFISSLQKD